MSLRAMLWALNDAPVNDPTQVLVLIALADNANDDGTGSWPAVALIAARARCSTRTAQRALVALKDLHVIREGNQALVSRYPANRRPTVYDLNLRLTRPQEVERPGVTDWHPSTRGDTGGSPGVTPEAVRGDTPVTQTVPEPPREPSVEEPLPGEPGAIFALPAVPDGFDTWWSAYPRKTAKDAARKAYRAALKRGATAEALLAGAERYRDDRTRTAAFTAYPATWLNGGRWQDEGPAGASTQGGIVPVQDDHYREGGGW